MEKKKYKDYNIWEIRAIKFDECPCKCTTCKEKCDQIPVETCRKHLSENLD